LLLKNIAATDPQGHLKQFVEEVRLAVRAWRGGTLDEARRDLLQACIESGLLPTHHEASHALADAVAAYRKAAATLPKPTMVPGVVEHEGRPAALLARGDHKKPGDPVPRGFLEVLGAGPFEGGQSGRSELAARLVDPHNPLTARVMANRLWHWTFGMGIVPSVDDFGRMGEKPSHPELLDFIAARLQSGGWSARNFVLWLVETEAFQRSASPSASARERDPANALLSHASVRRLEAEEIRDALLQVSGELKTDAFGPPVDENTPRRSVYVRHRRGVLAPLFSVFDAPRPFTTLGRRSVTTVPAQSLLMLNDPSVRKLATVWAQRVEGKQSPPAANIEALFESAFGRRCTVQEREGALALAQESGLAGVAHALFNAKEFIYLR
jgi:hypothetical protein